MLKKLRIKFIAMNMVLAALVLILAFGAICYFEYMSNVSEVYILLGSTLERVHSDGASPLADDRISNDGGFLNGEEHDGTHAPDNDGEGGGETEGGTEDEGVSQAGDAADAANDVSDSAEETDGSDEGADDAPGIPSDSESPADMAANSTMGTPPEIGGRGDGDETLIPVAVYWLYDDGTYSVASDYATASISDELLSEATTLVQEADAETGYLSEVGLYFSKLSTEDGTLVAYADSSEVSSWKQLALILAGVGLAAMLVFFLVNIVFSRWALRPVQHAWSQQQQFMADASHELKTPLTVILANTAILESHSDSTVAEQSQWVESTANEAKRMQILVNDMLELARPENVAPQHNVFVDVDFSDLVEGDVLQFESVAFERDIALDSSLEEGIHIEGDVKRLQRLTSTLIDNACKYAGDGGRVDVVLARAGKDARLSVTNNGTVIAPEDLPHVFDRFYRADKARTSDTGGFGLGLAIAREVAREHGGDIAVASSPERGTTFTATLPLASGERG